MNNSQIDSILDAVIRNNLSQLIQLVQDGSDVDRPDRDNRTALFYVAKDGNTQIAKVLILHGADVNAKDKNLETPLHFAARSFQLAIAELLLQNGAAVDAQDVHGNTALSRAVFDSRGRGEMIKLLRSFGANIALKNRQGISPEALAKSIGNYKVGRFLDDHS